MNILQNSEYNKNEIEKKIKRAFLKIINNFIANKSIFLVIFKIIFFKKSLTNICICGTIIRRNGYAGVAELADAQDLKSCGP